MTRRVRLATAAQVELIEAARWYEYRRSGLGDDFLTAVTGAVEDLRDWAAIGMPVEVEGHGFRRIGVRGFPYHLPYRMTDAEVQVLAVAHDLSDGGHTRDDAIGVAFGHGMGGRRRRAHRRSIDRDHYH